MPPADRFLNVKAGQGITLRTSGQGSIGAQLGEYTLKLPDLSTISGDQRANIFDALPEADKAILSRANAANLAGVYHTLYRYVGPAGTVSLDRAHVDFTDASLWRAVNPMFSNDAALQLGARLAAGTELQFLFADRFGLFENSREVFVYNSRMLEGATGGQLAQLQANIAAARTAGLQVVDIGSGFLDPVWKAVDVPFVAQDGASAQQLKTGALVGDMRDPRYLTINLTRSLAVQAVDGVVSAYSDTTVAWTRPRAASAWATSMPPRASPSRSAPRAVPSSAPTRARWRARARSAWSPIATSWGTRDANGIYQYDGAKALQLNLGAGHALYVEAGGVARVAQQGGVDLNLVLANTKGTAQAGSSYQADANLRVGQVIAAGNVTLQAGSRS